MGSMHRGVNQQASPHVPQPFNHNYFAEQARRAGDMGPELGRSQSEHIRDHHHHRQHLYPQPYPCPLPHPYPFCPPHSHDMQEAIQREIEKQRIREEIIMSEIVRRRILEAEVRRELMMERELTLQRGSNGFPFGSSPEVGFDSPTRLLLSGTRDEGRSLEERNVFAGLNGRRDSEGSEALPFQRGTVDLRISEVKPESEGGKEKEKIILLAKPDENISGSKRKAVTPQLGVDASEFPADGILTKKAKEEWSCALCQVSATSERALNEHLQGKKHKLKVATLRTQRAGKNYTIGLLPKTTAKSTEDGAKSTSESLPLKKSGEASSNRDDLQEHIESDSLDKNQMVAVENVQKNGNLNKKRFRFWCEMCEVGVSSQKDMDAHQRGKKHVSWLKQSNQNGGVEPIESEGEGCNAHESC